MRAPDQIRRRTRFAGGRCWCAMVRTCEGAQLAEFALVLPLLVVLVVGIADFGAGFALKDKLTNAGRDGARIAVSKPDDLTNASSTACNGVPCSVQSAATSTVNYLTNAGVSACSLNPSSTSPTSNGPFAWTYTSPSNCPGTTNKMSIEIERAVMTPVTVAGTTTTVLVTRVTITYPYRWAFGSVVKLLAPSSNYATQLTLSAAVIMPNWN